VFLASRRLATMSFGITRAESLPSDIASSMLAVAAAVAAGRLTDALVILTSLRERTTAAQRLPAHHQRRRAMDDLGFLSLAHIDAAYSSLTAPAARLPFIEEKLEIIPPDTVFARLRARPSTDFYEHTRMTCTEFLILYGELRPFIVMPRHGSLAESEPHIARYSHRKLHPVDEFLLWLYHADGNKHTVLCLLFDVDRTSITVITDHVTRCMNAAWRDEIRWPDEEERKQLYGFFSCNEKAIACIDGTHCRIDVPANTEDEDSCFSTYKNYHSLNYLLCCDAFGVIRHLSGPFEGSFNDNLCFVASDFNNPALHMLNADEKLITDGGFAGFPMNLHPWTAPQMAAAAPAERKVMVSWNDEIKLNRALNEHVNHQLKSRVQALAGKWSRTMVRQGDIFMVAGRLLNRVKRVRLEYRAYLLQLQVEAS
jgi:hypothetical protein